MDRLDAAPFAGTLGGGQLVLLIAVETAILQHLTVAARGYVLQAQVDADRTLALRRGLNGHLNLDVEVPAAPGILDETPRSESVGVQSVAVPDAEAVSGEPHLAAREPGGAGLEGNPAEITARASGDAPAQLASHELPRLSGCAVRRGFARSLASFQCQLHINVLD